MEGVGVDLQVLDAVLLRFLPLALLARHVERVERDRLRGRETLLEVELRVGEERQLMWLRRRQVERVDAIRFAPHMVIFPSIALSLTLMAFNFLGDGLRDALDPRSRKL